MTRQPLRRGYCFLVLLLAALSWPSLWAHESAQPAQRLANIGEAADFSLTDQSGATFTMSDLKGKVVAINFIFTRCTHVCPMTTGKMVVIQRKLGDAFARDVHFVSVSIDTLYDSPQVLERYSQALGIGPSGWSFLLGSVDEVKKVAMNYGVFFAQKAAGDVSHNQLTTLVDRDGFMRVQYMGERFDPDEMLHDIRELVSEPG